MPMPSIESTPITFALTREDLVAFVREWIGESAQHTAVQVSERDSRFVRWLKSMFRKHSPAISWWIIIFTTLACGLLWGERSSYIFGFLLGVLLVGLLLFAVPRLRPPGLRTPPEISHLHAHLRWMQIAEVWHVVGEYTVFASEHGIRVMAPGADVTFSWSRLRPFRMKSFVGFSYGMGETILIPLRAFAGESDMQQYIARAMAWCEAAQPSLAERLRLYFLDRDVACLNCGYELRGLAPTPGDERCPECGDRLVIERFTVIGR